MTRKEDSDIHAWYFLTIIFVWKNVIFAVSLYK